MDNGGLAVYAWSTLAFAFGAIVAWVACRGQRQVMAEEKANADAQLVASKKQLF